MDSIVLWLLEKDAPRSEALHVRGLGYCERMANGIVNRAHGTEDYLLMHFHSPVEVLVEGRMQACPAHSSLLWGPGDRHTFGSRERPWVHSWIHGGGAGFAAAVACSGIRSGQPVVLPDAYFVERYLLAIHSEIRDYVDPDPAILEAHLRIWIRELHRAAHKDPATSRLPPRMVATRRFIEANLAQSLSLSRLATEVNLSITHFSAEFRRCFQTSPHDYVLRLRLQQAAYYLRDHNLSIAQVAAQVGFTDPFYFSRLFRKRYGLSPGEYRKSEIQAGAREKEPS